MNPVVSQMSLKFKLGVLLIVADVSASAYTPPPMPPMPDFSNGVAATPMAGLVTTTTHPRLRIQI
jgi:hypothetical protein